MGKGAFGPSASFNPAIQANIGTLLTAPISYYNPGVYVVVFSAITAGLNPTATFDANTNLGPVGIAQLFNGASCHTAKQGPGLTAVFNKDVTVDQLTATTCRLTGIDTSGMTYAPIGSPGSLDPAKNFGFTINIDGPYRSINIDYTTIGGVFPLVNGRYEIRDFNVHLLQIAGQDAAHRLPLRIINGTIANQNPSADVQLVNCHTGHLDLTFCDAVMADLVIEHGTGGINSYSQPLAGGGSSDGVIVPQGATFSLAGCTGFINGYDLRQCAYDGYKLNGQMEAFSFAHGTHHRHDSLVGGGHTDGFQITALDNALLGNAPTFYFVWAEAGGHSCIYYNDYQGDNVHKIKNNIADTVLFYKGNNAVTYSHGRFCCTRNCYFPDPLGDGNPGVLPMLECDVGSSDATHGDSEFMSWYNNYRKLNNGTDVLIPQNAVYPAWRTGAGQVLGAYPT